MVIRNTIVQGTLSILYAALVLIVFLIGLGIAIRAVRNGGLPTGEAEGKPSKIFAPASFAPTRLEKEVLAEWQAAGINPSGEDRLPGMHHRSQQETVQEENQL